MDGSAFILFCQLETEEARTPESDTGETDGRRKGQYLRQTWRKSSLAREVGRLFCQGRRKGIRKFDLCGSHIRIAEVSLNKCQWQRAPWKFLV